MKIVKRIKAFIFDLDGVITNTTEYHFQSWKRLAEEEKISFTRKDNDKLRGLSREKSLEIFLKGQRVSEGKMKKMLDKKNYCYQQLINTITPNDLFPGVKELLNNLKKLGIKISLASASKNARIVIRNLAIEDLFDNISDGYSVRKNKPAPDLFLHAARNLDIEPEEAIVVEDAEAGVEAALAAKMMVVGIGPKERVGKAHYRYDSVANINLLEIIY